MNIEEKIKSRVNLWAVLKNLEKLPELDEEAGKLTKDWNITIEFRVKSGPSVFVKFENGTCKVSKTKQGKTDVVLFFTSDKHLNKMFDGKANPIPLKGFTKLGFMSKEFPKVTDKLEYYLKPTPELLKDKKYEEINTIFTLITAANALPAVMEFDPKAHLTGEHLTKGRLLLKIKDNEGVLIDIDQNHIEVVDDDPSTATCEMIIKDIPVANKFLNGEVDIYAALAKGDLEIKGQTWLLDNVGLILDRIPVYIQ